ncbi:Zinc finger, C3HC4 type (RING finger) [Musa troglodytarum]|uniref:Zinc finger, C3HC4 type (RING finger) n=1 Tax=Musa troglodytarum TaxID=320322 RepID=A0A9E7E874_9LILI|nr:Zinc finger, C3HC4 type (RING finger) [Musa troglodytarum]
MATPLQDSSPFDALATTLSSFTELFSRALVLCILSIFNYAILVTFLTKIPRVLYVVPSSSPSPPVSVVVSEPDMESCVICMDEFVSGEELWVLPRCKHLFHGVCIERWLLAPSMTCPVCRKHVIHGEAIAPRSHYINIDTDELHFLVSTSL